MMTTTPRHEAPVEKAGEDHPAPEPKKATADLVVVLALGDHAIVRLGYPDKHDRELGPMRSPGAGKVNSSDPNIVTAVVQTVDGEDRLRLDSHNPGDATITYRQGEKELVIPVLIVVRVPDAIVVGEVVRGRDEPLVA